MSSNTTLNAVKDRGWLNGFGNIFRKENHQWWGTWHWLVQVLIWLAIVNGILAAATLISPKVQAAQDKIQAQQQIDGKSITAPIPPLAQTALMVFFIISGMAPAVGVVILEQDAIIQERQTGTAAWVLSKPVSRKAFLLSKLSADFLNILVTMVLVQGLVASQIYRVAVGKPLPFFGFLSGLGLLALLLMFYLALTFTLGSLFRNRGPVIGIPMVLIFAPTMVGIPPWLGKFMPWNLVMDLGQKQPSLAIALAIGQSLPTVTPIIGTAVLISIFVLVALWRFQREEF
jgi:ABC-2 type transport system permease protein